MDLNGWAKRSVPTRFYLITIVTRGHVAYRSFAHPTHNCTFLCFGEIALTCARHPEISLAGRR